MADNGGRQRPPPETEPRTVTAGRIANCVSGLVLSVPMRFYWTLQNVVDALWTLPPSTIKRRFKHVWEMYPETKKAQPKS
jgi:hypothetical protein